MSIIASPCLAPASKPIWHACAYAFSAEACNVDQLFLSSGESAVALPHGDVADDAHRPTVERKVEAAKQFPEGSLPPGSF
jgi:hypothetical protein